MTKDPYGYTDAGPVSVPVVNVLWYSVGACICAALGMCACYIPFFIGSPLGLYGAWHANKALAAAKDERDRSVASAALAAGLAGGLVSTMFAVFILMYMLFFAVYLAFMVLVMGAAASWQGF